MEDSDATQGRMAKARLRQYEIELENISSIDSYTLRNGIKKSEVVNMALKKFFKSGAAKTLAAAVVVLLTVAGQLWAPGMDSISETSLIDMLGGLFKTGGVVVGYAGLGYALLVGGWEWKDDQGRAIEHIKGGVICAICGFGCWGIAKLIMKSLGA